MTSVTYTRWLLALTAGGRKLMLVAPTATDGRAARSVGHGREGDWISDYRIFMDLAPLFAQKA